MLNGDLVNVRVNHKQQRVHACYIERDNPRWLEVAESLLLIYREGVGLTRGEIEEEVDALFGGGGKALVVQRGLAKILEDRAEFEIVADVPPETIRARVFGTAAAHRLALLEKGTASGPRREFRRDAVLDEVAAELNLSPETILGGMFADLRDENRLLGFEDLTAQRLIDRYNVGLAQAILLRSVRVTAEVRNEKPARYRQLFRRLKFHRLLHRVEGSMKEGYTFHIDGPMSLFAATTRYGLQMALFLPSLLQCGDFRLDAELRWGPKREPRSFHIESGDGLISPQADQGTYVPNEIGAFVERFRNVAPAWELSESTEVIPLGKEGIWVPDFRIVHKASQTEVFLEVLGFWKKSSLDRLTKLLPKHGPPRYVLAISDKLKVDEETAPELTGPILRFKEIPNANELASLLGQFIGEGEPEAKNKLF